MATVGTPFSGLTQLGAWTYQTYDLTLICYINSQNSLNDNSVFGDLIQPTVANGYAPITLNHTVWVNTNGIMTYSPNPTWSASGVWSATVNGYAIYYSTTLLHFKDLSVPFNAASGKKLTIDLTTVV